MPSNDEINDEIMAALSLWAPMLRRIAGRFGVEINEVRSVALIEYHRCRRTHKNKSSFARFWLRCIEFRLIDLTRATGEAGDTEHEHAVFDDPAAILQAVQEVSPRLHLAEPAPRKKNCTRRHLRRLVQQARARAEAALMAGWAA